VNAHDALTVSIGIIRVVLATLLRFSITREVFDGVRNVETSIRGTLQDSEATGSRNSTGQADVEDDLGLVFWSFR
jgi:hypothetical protein